MLRTTQESLFCSQKQLVSAPYTIYSASAGSGKTSTLVKEYLKIILGHGPAGKYRQILAITFTNKAVNEMKGRILESLFSFSQSEAPETGSHIFRELCREMGVSAQELSRRSGRVLKELLHNYAFFDVSTIDKFTHRLIRTFARDLKLPQNFEVVLDTNLLLEEAIANLLGKAGEDKALTRLLIAFALEKIDDDRSWDIAYDLFKTGKLLFNENHLGHLKQLEAKDHGAFGALKETIRKGIGSAENTMARHARDILASIDAHELQRQDFSRGYFPDFMASLDREEFHKVNFNASWKQRFDEEVPYNKNCPAHLKATIDGLLPKWRVLFSEIRLAFQQWSMLQNAYRNLVPLTILNALQQEVKALEGERDLLPISSFNNLISEEIKHQPAPFIYERLGEKYRHYFIDEFQDTSGMQWQNLIPLIANALEGADAYGNHGSLFLVGDAKQAIYRWRGGKAEQFLNLLNGQALPFTVAPRVALKSSNYRSNEEIVHFNNDFFRHISGFLEHPLYRDLYMDGSQQQPEREKGGLVQLQFISPADRSKEELYCEGVLGCIDQLRGQHYDYSHICILTRTRAQGVLIADYLLQQGIPIISSETLLLKNHPKVSFLIALLQYCLLPSDKNAAYELLYFLAGGKDPHRFISSHLNDPDAILLERYGFKTGYVKHAPVYDGLEYAIGKFGLAGASNAYLTFLMDEALSVEQKEDSSIPTFLAYWEKQKEKLSVVAPEAMDAIQIMTIHKAKGLEFPVVLYPFANTDIYNSRNEKDAVMWVPVDPEQYAGFTELLLSKKKEMTTYSQAAEQLYLEERHKLELDAFNLLYVAFTRAEKALFVLTENELDAKGKPKMSQFSGLLIHYLMDKGLWNKDQHLYTIGTLPEITAKPTGTPGSTSIAHLYSYRNRPEFRIIAQSGMLWDSGREEALTRGNLVHAVMAEVNHPEDLEPALDRMVRRGDLTTEGALALESMARNILEHPDISLYYKEGLTIRNETEIFTAAGEVIRPDRIVIQGDSATLIDYKTGQKDPAYSEQLNTYARALESMGFVVANKIIVYINEEVTTEFI